MLNKLNCRQRIHNFDNRKICFLTKRYYFKGVSYHLRHTSRWNSVTLQISHKSNKLSICSILLTKPFYLRTRFIEKMNLIKEIDDS